MVGLAKPQVPWQAVAVELLRRVTGAPVSVALEQGCTAEAERDAALTANGMDHLYFTACGIDHPRRRAYRALWQAQQAEARAVIDELGTQGARPIVCKGLEVGTRYLPAHGLYPSGDVDLLFASRDLWAVEKALYARGYARTQYIHDQRSWQDYDPVESLRVQATHYELVPFVKFIPVEGADPDCLAAVHALPGKYRYLFDVRGDVLHVAVRFDVHHNLLPKFDIAPFLARSVVSALGTGWTLDLADHLWFLIHRQYFEVALGMLSELRILLPIAALVSDSALDWSRLLGNAIAARATAPCFYWLTFLRQLGAPGIPREVLAELRSHHRSSQLNYGWQLERLFGLVEAFPDSLSM